MRRALHVVLALSLFTGCHSTPAPFDPGTDCPKETYCGQCASRGAWCGDPNDSSKGQCVLAELAKSLHWQEIPRYVDSAAPAAGAAPSKP